MKRTLLSISTLFISSIVTYMTRPVESELIKQKYLKYEAAELEVNQGAQDIGRRFKKGAKKFKFW